VRRARDAFKRRRERRAIQHEREAKTGDFLAAENEAFLVPSLPKFDEGFLVLSVLLRTKLFKKDD